MAAIGYPRFLFPESRDWFFHWLDYRLKNCPAAGVCDTCSCVRDVIEFGTSVLIESLYEMHHKFTAGSDVVSINIGHMSKKKARRIIAETPRVVNSQQVLDARLQDSLARDFPGIKVQGLSKYAGAYAPIMGMGGNSLYHTLSVLYKSAVLIDTTDSRVSNITVVDFCLLCFHLNKQYLLTSNAVSYLWSEAIKLNSITTILHDECSLDTYLSDDLFDF